MQYVGARAPVQSVCRQCFSTCEVDTADNQKMCFGGSNTGTKMTFDMKLATFQETGCRLKPTRCRDLKF